MVTELEVKTFAEKSVKMPLFTGYVARGLALHILNRVDPALSQDLHEPNAIKPYSVTPLYFRSTKKLADGYQLDASTPCIFKIRFLDDRIAKSAIDYFSSNESLMIYDTAFKVSSLTIKSEDFTKVQDSKLFRLYFETPTHLAKIGSKFDQVFPEPLSVFPNLMRAWDSCMPEKFGKKVFEKYKEWMEKNVTVSAYDLHTLTVTAGKTLKIGFTGWCAYRIDDSSENPQFRLITNKLAKFAEYSNVGMERTAGFGVVKLSA
ncbi:putative CRISPR-associated protein, Cas6 family [Candidatus Nitrososphaera gargensis Ga9.2]|uniref:Putative CRISPR-associated protein, Cas6 family n=1 Tax=Nitrososphaera gargensis (strain Ga9.2) TaxID=1237085 RepID=K0I7U3_NITGG|nr:CRISPR-associated endoribonuclease Cas6 [Candidatus Nitrososphaera gargensis]AFU57336.1 putative CRISPR-associated protein, Cas6 family [Candidatus Nitrososphaera gargensis Ga9.2]